MKQKLLLTLILLFSLLGSSWAQTATAPSGTGTATDPYLIANVNNLYWLSKTPSVWNKGYYYKQTADIDLTGINWTAIGTDAIRFSGNYDGCNNAISNLTITNASTNDQGLFGSMAEGSVIQNLTISKASITTLANYAGIVAAINRGQIINCHTKSGSITGVGYVGGICAIVDGVGSRIERCYNSSTVTATGQYVGGIVAQAQNATIEQCSNTSPIKSTLATIGSADIGGIVGNVPDLGTVHTTINNCYNASSVSTTRGNSAGGIIGSGSGITMNNCYSLDGIVANSQVGGLMGLAGTRNTFSNCFTLQSLAIGYNETLVTRNNVKQVTTTELGTQSTFTNWDFAGETTNGVNDIWLCSPSLEGYPAFAEQLLAASFISENSGTLTFPIQGTTNCYVLVDWGDGTQETKSIVSTSELSHQYIKGNVVKIYTNNIIMKFQAISQGLTSLTLGRHKGINQLYSYSNNLNQLTSDYNTAVKNIYCYNNKLSIATLPRPRSSYTTYTYSPQQQLAATCTNGVVDLSSQFTAFDVNGSPQTTIYTWYLKDNTPLTKGFDYIENNGVFQFIKMPTSTIYCTMANAAFPNFTGSDILRTTDITIDAIAPITWTGATDTDWNTASNWSDNIIPTADNNVVIPKVTNLPVISTSTSADCNNLNINTDASLTIASSAAGTGSLIVHGISTGNVTVQSYLSANQWHLVTPPVEGGNISSFITSADNAIKTNGGSAYGMADYNEATNSWKDYFSLANVGANTFTAGKGYEVLRSSDGIVAFTGTLTTGDKTVSLVKGSYGWNCVGNPYTSAININATTDNNAFLHYNAGSIDSNYGAIYLWDPSSSQYKVICNSGAGLSNGQLSQNYIAPGQGFFVKAASDGATVTFTRDMQSHQSSGNAPLRAKKMAWPSIRLNVVNNNKTTSTVVAFNESMTKGLDPTYDAGLLRGTSGLNLYTRLVDDNGVDFAVQCLPEEYNNLVIPLGVESKNGGDVTFDAETVSLPSTCNVILEDKATNTFTSLANGGKYTATVTANASGTGRFYLHTSTLSTLPAGTATNSDNAVNAYAVGKVIYINSKLTNAEVSLYDISGKSIHADKLTSDGTFTLNESNLSDGVYLLRVISSGKTYGFKLVLKN